MEQRARIKFRFKTDKTATETFQLIKQAYYDNAVSCTWVSECYSRFWDGCENLEADKRGGQPTAIQTPDMIKTVQEFISTEHQVTLRMMEEILKISRETVHKILVEGLGKQKISTRFIPHCLANEQKALRLQACQVFIRSLDDDRPLLDSVVKSDETSCFQYDPQMKTVYRKALTKLSKTKNFDSKSPKTKWYWSHSYTVRESFTKKLFHQARQ
jgi:hypothetical protein